MTPQDNRVGWISRPVDEALSSRTLLKEQRCHAALKSGLRLKNSHAQSRADNVSV
jgi:hypothetical protein